MVEQKAQDRTQERAPIEARVESDRATELSTRKGGYDRIASETLRAVETSAQTAEATTKAATDEAVSGLGKLVDETSRGLRAAMMLPIAPGAGFSEFQESMSELIAGMMRNNLRLTQDLLRIYNPQDQAVQMQKFMRQWVDAVTEGQATMLRMAGQVAQFVPGPAPTPVERPGTASS